MPRSRPQRLTAFLRTTALSLVALFALAPWQALAVCCKCTDSATSATNFCLSDTVASSCGDLTSASNVSGNAALSKVSCITLVDPTNCHAVGSGGASAQCVGEPVAPVAYKPGATSSTTNAVIETITAPVLNVPIPGLVFANNIQVYANTPNAQIPFLTQYISAVYNYLIGISVIAAAIMIVFGGFKYIIASSISQVKDGKETIKDAILGLVLIFGAYTIFAVINPAAINLKALNEPIINPEQSDALNALGLMSRAGDDPGDTRGLSGGPGGASSSLGPTGFSDCPIALSSPDSGKTHDFLHNPRSTEFLNGISSAITATTFQDKVVQISSAAVKCGVQIADNCGATVGAIWTLAGAQADTSCVKAIRGCNASHYPPNSGPEWAPNPANPSGPWIKTGKITPAGLGRVVFAIDLSLVNGVMCSARDCATGVKRLTDTSVPACAKSRGEGIAIVTARMKSKYTGWPDTQADLLKPGDFMTVYSGNDDCAGNHAVLFTGWSGNFANGIQASNGVPVGKGSYCIKSGCSADSFLPLTGIDRANGQ